MRREIGSFVAEIYRRESCHSKIRRPSTDAEETESKATWLMSLPVKQMHYKPENPYVKEDFLTEEATLKAPTIKRELIVM